MMEKYINSTDKGSQKDNIHYFAYGSNINLVQMNARCPMAQFVKVGKLKNYKLVFNKTCKNDRFDLRFANIHPSENNCVEGYVYEMPKKELSILDRFECYPTEYDRKELKVNVGNEKLTAWAYIAQGNNTASGLPRKVYMSNIVHSRLSKDYIDKVKNVYIFLDWFNAVEEDDNPFGIYNNYWTSFNKYYNTVFSEASESENQTLTKLKNNLEIKSLFEILLKHPNFNKLLHDFRVVIKREDGKCYVINMKNKDKIKYNNESSFEQFVNVMYQIRCNTVHGEKTPYGPNDQNIVKNAWPVLKMFLKSLYEPFL